MTNPGDIERVATKVVPYYVVGTALAYATIVTSIAAAITAVLSLILGLQRRWAAFGLALGILANPLIVLNVFRFFGG